MQPVRRFLAVAGTLAALTAGTGAQTPQPPQTPQTSQDPAPPAPDPSQPVFRTGINFVRVDVIATDKQGNPVTDLAQNDFEVQEDSRPQKVETFRLVKFDTQVPIETQRPIQTRADEETAAADDNSRIIVFFLDDYHVRLGNSMGARKPLAAFVASLSPNDLVAVMYPLMPLDSVVLTRDHQSIIHALERFEGRKFNYDPKNAAEEKYAYYPTEVVENIRRQVSLSALRGLAIKLGALREGRKALVLVSEGYSSLLPPQLRDPIAAMPGLGNPNRRNPQAGENSTLEDRARFAADLDVQQELQDVFDSANRSNTAIYSLDPRGLAVNEFDINEAVGMRQDQDQLRATQDSLRTLAENTDGRAIVNRNDLGKGLQQLVKDSSAYYLLGYNSTPAPTDGKFHEIKVRVKRPGIQVRARKGYWALSATETARVTAPPKPGPPPAVSRAMATIADTGGRRLVRTWVGTGPGEEGKTKVTFVWEPIPAPPGVRREEARRLALTASAGGVVLFRARVPEDAAAAPGRGASVVFEVPPGKLVLKMAVEGDGDGALDQDSQDVVVPDLTSPQMALGTARVFVSRSGREYQQLMADQAPVPTALREFRRTDRLLVRVELLGKATTAPTFAARLLNKQGQKMTDIPVVAPSTLGQPVAVDLPLSSLPAGEFLLEVSAAVDGGSPATELVPFRVTG